MNEQAQIRVVIVDDQDLIRTGFALILASDPLIEVVAEAANGREAIEVVKELAAAGSAPHLVLMDVRMPEMNGIEATRHIVSETPETRVLVLTTFDLDEYAVEAIEAGASGFLLKDARAEELISAVHAVAIGDAVIAPSVTLRLIERLRGSGAHTMVEPAGEVAAAARELPEPQTLERVAQLTEREVEVFRLIAEGLSNPEIGERLFLSESTVKTHVGRVLGKLGLRDRVHAVILAYEIGLR